MVYLNNLFRVIISYCRSGSIVVVQGSSGYNLGVRANISFYVTGTYNNNIIIASDLNTDIKVFSRKTRILHCTQLAYEPKIQPGLGREDGNKI